MGRKLSSKIAALTKQQEFQERGTRPDHRLRQRKAPPCYGLWAERRVSVSVRLNATVIDCANQAGARVDEKIASTNSGMVSLACPISQNSPAPVTVTCNGRNDLLARTISAKGRRTSDYYPSNAAKACLAWL